MEKKGVNKTHYATLCDNVRQKISTLNGCLLAVCDKCNYFSVNLLLANTESNLHLILNKLHSALENNWKTG